MNYSLDSFIKKTKQIASKQTINIDWEAERQILEKKVELYQNKKDIKQFRHTQDKAQLIGIEFNPNIKTEEEYINFIMKNHLYVPQIFLCEDQLQEFGTALDECDQLDRRNFGSIIGCALIGVLGFVALGFTIIGLLAGGVLGILLGRYAGKRIKKRLKQNNELEEFDIFEIRIRCYIKWARIRGKKYIYNLNLIRFIAEKLMLELKPALHLKKFSPKHEKYTKHLLNKTVEIFKQENIQYALLLSLKISQRLLKLLKEMNEEQDHPFECFRNEIEVILLKHIDNVHRPMVALFEEVKIKQTVALTELTKKFLVQADILNITQQFPDPQMSLSYIRMLAERLKVKVKPKNLQEYIKAQNFRDIEQLERQINQSIVKKQDAIRNDMIVIIEEEERLQSDQASEDNNMKKEQELVEYDDENQQQLEKQQQKSYSSRSIKHQNSELKLNIKQHPNRVFLSKLVSRPGDEDQLCNLQLPLNDIQNIYILLEPEQSLMIDKQKRPSLQTPQKQSLQMIEQFQEAAPQPIYDSETMRKFQIFYEYYKEPFEQWENVTKKDDIYIYKTMKPGSQSIFLKGHSLIRGVDKDIVFRAVYDKPFRIKWDKIMQGFEIVKHEADNIDVMYYYVDAPFHIVDTREWLQRRILRKDFPEKDQICLLFYSIELPEIQVARKRVRAYTEISGYIFENIPEGTKISFISNNDVKGSIPKILVNHASQKGPFGWFGNLRQACRQYMQYGGDISKINLR